MPPHNPLPEVTSRPAPPPPALAKPIGFRGLLRALRRQWALGLSAGLAAGVVAGCVVYALLPAAKFTARATLQVNAAAPGLLDPSEPQADFETLKGTIPVRIKSRVVLDEVVSKPEVKGLSILAAQADPYEFLQTELVVDWIAGSEVLTVQMSGDRPKELAALANAVADAAVLDVNGRDLRDRQHRLERLEQAHRQYEASLAPRRKELEELARRPGADPGERVLRQAVAALALSARQAELLKVRGERRGVEALLKVQAASRPSEPAPKPADAKAALDDAMKADPVVQPLMAEIADLNTKIARYAALYKDDPDKASQVIQEKGYQAQIDTLYAQARSQHEKKLRALGGRGGADSSRPPADSAEELKARLAFCEASEEALEKEIKKLEADLRGPENRYGEIEAIRQEIQVREGASKNVAAALEKLRLDVAAPPRASRLDEATVLAVRDERRPWIAGLAGLGGFALALFNVGLLEARRRKLYTAADVTRGLELPVAGTQPILPPALNPLDARHAAAQGKAAWHGQLNDGVDAVRALVTRAAPPTAPRVVAVVSAVGGEGSSVLAVQLAAGLARAGRRTLLLDANLRRPALHRAFGVAAEPGLADVLRGAASLPSAVRPAPAERLWLLPAGAADLRALLALSREAVQTALDQLKKDYDYVVIDAAPVLPCADSLLLTQRADAVLLSALAGVSATPFVYSAWERLAALGARLLGVVVQGAADDAPRCGTVS
jgi:capsular exopolysaccharide synthesis family protein